MKVFAIFLCVLSLTAFGVACGGGGGGGGSSAPAVAPVADDPPVADSYTLSGIVRDADNENPLENASIQLAMEDESSMTMETGFPGTFTFTGVGGSVSLMVMHDGYANLLQDLDLSSDTSVQLDLQRVAGRSGPCGEEPDIGNRVFPLMSSPFIDVAQSSDGPYRLSTYMDHGPDDDDGTLLTVCGESVTYGGRGDGHRAYDWGLIPVGTPLLATFDGTVFLTGTSEGPCDPDRNEFGREVTPQLNVMILSDSLPTYEVWYAHLDRIDVLQGQRVTSGQVIGLAGTTGCDIVSRIPFVHFGVCVRHPDTQRDRIGLTRCSPVDPYGWEGRIPDPMTHPLYPDAGNLGGAESVWLWLPGEAPRLLPCCLLEGVEQQKFEPLNAQSLAKTGVTVTDEEINYPALVSAIVRDQNLDPLTAEEERYLRVLLAWQGEFEQGHFTESDIPVENWRYLIRRFPAMANLWQARGMFSYQPDFVQFMEENIVN